MSWGGVEHPVGEHLAGLGQAPGVEGLEPPVDQLRDIGATLRAVVANRFAAKKLSLLGGGRSWRAVRHGVV